MKPNPFFYDGHWYWYTSKGVESKPYEYREDADRDLELYNKYPPKEDGKEIA